MDKNAIVKLHLAEYESELDKRKEKFKQSDYVKHSIATRKRAIEDNYEVMLEVVKLQILHGLNDARAAAELGLKPEKVYRMKAKWPWLELLCIEEIEDSIRAENNAQRIRSQARLVRATGPAMDYIENVLVNEEVPHGIRYKAAKDVMDTSGTSMKAEGKNSALEQSFDTEKKKQMNDVMDALKGVKVMKVVNPDE